MQPRDPLICPPLENLKLFEGINIMSKKAKTEIQYPGAKIRLETLTFWRSRHQTAVKSEETVWISSSIGWLL